MVRISRPVAGIVALTVLVAAPLFAFRQPDESPVQQKVYRHADLYIGNILQPASELPASAASNAGQSLAALGLAPAHARMDLRSGRWGTLLLSEPMLPGSANSLTWQSLRAGSPASHAAHQQAAWDAFADYLKAHDTALRLDVSEVASPGRVAVYGDGDKVQIVAQREVLGVSVRGSNLVATISQGNLVLLGAQKWGDINVSPIPSLSAEEAEGIVAQHLSPFVADTTWRKSQLELIPMAKGTDLARIGVGQGYTYRLAWVISPKFSNDLADWEGLVDAHTGELLSFEDKTSYASTRTVQGGVYPISNDGVAPDGVEVTYVLPFADITNSGTTYFSDSGGNIPVCLDGDITSTLSGQFITMIDNCGPVTRSTSGDILDFGTSGGIDCTTPVGGSAGNTHATRSGYYELNRIAEMARGFTPNDPWLNSPLPATMNINSNCNASGGGGGVNFFTSGGGCSNTGELAGVFDHEWGHGRDATDVNPGISSPGEGIADIYASLRLNTSCIGRNFRLGNNCGGYGDPCTSCDGVRDIDFANRASGNPHDLVFIDSCGPGNSNGPCGGSVHCEGAVYAESVWDIWNRDMPNLYGFSTEHSRQLATSLTFIGAAAVGSWYNCVAGTGTGDGCNADGGYLNYLAADDDNGDLTDGTPHMQAIFDAFDRRGIACATPTVQDSGCAGAPATAPVVTTSPLDRGMELSWGAVAGANSYRIYRTEGVNGCDFGKTIVGETSDLSFIDSNLANGQDYFYVVTAIGNGETCISPPSTCTTATPTAGANLSVPGSTTGVQVLTGDGDMFLDNCEDGRVSFEIQNIGTGSLTNVRIDSVTSTSHPAIDASITFPAVAEASLADCGIAIGNFDFVASDLAFNDILEFEVQVTSDELSPATRMQTVRIPFTESDFSAAGTQTFDFESDNDGWTVNEGTFARSSALGGGDGTTFAEASSGGLDNQCDRMRSPIVNLNNNSTLSLWNNYTIENVSGGLWYDRANVAIVEGDETRTPVVPSSGRPYNTTNETSYSGCNPTAGWAGTNASWATSSWNAAALQSSTFAGQPVQIEVTYGTDGGLALSGFSFDEVTITNASLQVPDTQSNTCGVSALIFADGFETGNTSLWSSAVQ